MLMLGSVSGTSIQIDLGPPAVYTNTNLGPISFSDLNGTAVNGSTLSLDFLFPSPEFVELFSSTSSSFEVSLALQTNAGTFPGFVTNASSYLLAQDGSAIPGANQIGRSDSSGGATFVGLFPLPPASGTFPLDFYGVHFNFTLPDDPAVSITGSNFTLFTGPFEVGPHVPDSDSTLPLLTLSAFIMVGFQWAVGMRRT